MKKKVYPCKTTILPLSFATCDISLVPGTWDISRFESVSGLLDHPVDACGIITAYSVMENSNAHTVFNFFSKHNFFSCLILDRVYDDPGD
jgi:hypothetical protein